MTSDSSSHSSEDKAMPYARSARIAFTDMLGTLDHLVSKAQEAGLGVDVLDERLSEDMFPLELQLRVALNQVLLAINQVGSGAIPLEEASYTSLSQVRERIAFVHEQIDRTVPDNWAEPDSAVDLTLPNGVRFVMSAQQDVRDWLLPNFYFHVTMAYVLLRKAGLSIGKMDFLPHMSRYIALADAETPGAEG